MKLLSFFSGCGGLDLGFKKAGFKVVWANDNSPSVKDTYTKNFPDTKYSSDDIRKIQVEDLPNDIVGIIGGPPCQSWSNAGRGLGIEDSRGKLFLTFIDILHKKQPEFFVAENVRGILSPRNKVAYDKICKSFSEAGYDLFVDYLNAADFGVPQNRDRVFFIGFRSDLSVDYHFPKPLNKKVTVQDAIGDLSSNAVAGKKGHVCKVDNHEYWEGGYSYIFMSRNRVLSWKGQSFTIQASGRQTSIHPQAPAMEKVEKDVMRFVPGEEYLYRRLTVRECARLQTFPDEFIFRYENLNNGYKMVGNAVPVSLAYHVARSIIRARKSIKKKVPRPKKQLSQ